MSNPIRKTFDNFSEEELKKNPQFKLVLDFLKTGNQTQLDITKHVQMDRKACSNLIRNMVYHNFIVRLEEKKDGKPLYAFKYQDCLLATVLGYTPENFHFKVKSIQRRTATDKRVGRGSSSKLTSSQQKSPAYYTSTLNYPEITLP